MDTASLVGDADGAVELRVFSDGLESGVGAGAEPASSGPLREAMMELLATSTTAVTTPATMRR